MKDSFEVKLFKGEVELYKQRLKNSNTSTRANITRTVIGNPTRDIKNPDENTKIEGLENGVKSQTTYTLSTGYVSSDGIMVTYKSQKDKIKIIKGFLEHIYIYYKKNNHLYESWIWPPYNEDTDQETKPPSLIINNFLTKDLFLSMINEKKFNYFNDKKIILHLTNLEEYYSNNKQTFLDVLENKQNENEEKTSVYNQVAVPEETLTEQSVYNFEQNTIQNVEEEISNITYLNMEQYIYVRVINSNGNKYIFENEDTTNEGYDENQKYVLGRGSYVFKNVPENHPIAFLNTDNINNINYVGDINKLLNKDIIINNENKNYNFYWGDVILNIIDIFNNISVYCYHHGYMGGENILYYSPDITKSYIISETNDNKKILCLHGGGESSETFKNQQGMQELMNSSVLSEYEFIFVNSPLSSNLWWDDPIDKDTPTYDINHADTSIQFITNYINTNGPFHGILGFSQGATMAIILLTYTSFIFEKVILFNGYLPETHLGLMNSINSIKPFDETPLIFLANNDTNFYNLGLNIKSIFNSYNQIISDTAGHALPISTDSTFQNVVDYIIDDYDDNIPHPTNITLSNNIINENASINSLVGIFETVGGTPPYTYKIYGNYSSYFVFDTNQKNKLLNNYIFDYETQNQYDISVIVRDFYNLTSTKNFTINIQDVSESNNNTNNNNYYNSGY